MTHLPQRRHPVVKIGINKTKPAGFHYKIAQKLTLLRDEGISIIGNGNNVYKEKAIELVFRRKNSLSEAYFQC